MSGSSAIRVQRPKRGKSGVIAIDSGPAEIWLGPGLVNAAKGLRFSGLLAIRWARGIAVSHGQRTARCKAGGGPPGWAAGEMPATEARPVTDFMILTDFSRCQCHAI